ncbi:MAG: hypothetical protein EBU08_10890 [Micrococcales bacterium]|nr:hypothetical protein [Micrococcales bacterium]
MMEVKDLDSAMEKSRKRVLQEGFAKPKQGVPNENRSFDGRNVRFSRFRGLLAGCDRLVSSRDAESTLKSLDLVNPARSCVSKHRL